MPPKRSTGGSGGGIQCGLLMQFVVVGGLVGLGVFALMMHAVGDLHAGEQVALPAPHIGGAPVLAHPDSHVQSPELGEAASARAQQVHRLLGEAWAGLRGNPTTNRKAGPFLNLPGSVGHVAFTYNDVLPAPPDWSMVEDLGNHPYSGYPPLEPLKDIVGRWNPDDSDGIPNPFHEQLQVFNYSDPAQRAMAEKYRNAEVPFKVFGVPDIEAVTEKWTDAYLEEHMNSKRMNYKVEESTDNHFMYWTNRGYKGVLGSFKPPTKVVRSTSYNEWRDFAHQADAMGIEAGARHLYLMTGVEAGRIVAKRSSLSQFISSDLAIFSTTTPNFFVTNVDANKGIQCRFGMKGVIAEAHYDGGRNMVAMLKGAKRYILAPPTECKGLSIIKEKAHPSYRHSLNDWTDPKEPLKDPKFAEVMAIDTIVHEGEVLYIPSYWFHYIQSLDFSVQCNTRSGSPPNGDGEGHIAKCMRGGLDEETATDWRAKLERQRESHHPAESSERSAGALRGAANA